MSIKKLFSIPVLKDVYEDNDNLIRAFFERQKSFANFEVDYSGIKKFPLDIKIVSDISKPFYQFLWQCFDDFHELRGYTPSGNFTMSKIELLMYDKGDIESYKRNDSYVTIFYCLKVETEYHASQLEFLDPHRFYKKKYEKFARPDLEKNEYNTDTIAMKLKEGIVYVWNSELEYRIKNGSQSKVVGIKFHIGLDEFHSYNDQFTSK